MVLQVFAPIPIYRSLARRAEMPGALGFLGCRTGGFEFCRFCHFRVLTAKSDAPITRLVAEERPCGPASSDF
jgi:hypothetical protein